MLCSLIDDQDALSIFPDNSSPTMVSMFLPFSILPRRESSYSE